MDKFGRIGRFSLLKPSPIDISSFDASERNKNLRLQVISSFVIRAFSIAINYLLVPLTLNYLGKEDYGIWISLLSLITIMSMADMGIGNGLKNNLVKALAVNDLKKAKILISSSYTAVAIISLILFSVCYLLINFINIGAFLQIPDSGSYNIRTLITVFCAGVCLYFILNIISQIFSALQRNEMMALPLFVSNFLFLLTLFLFKKYLLGDLQLMLTVNIGLIVISYIAFTILFFVKFPQLQPSVKSVEKESIRQLIKLGSNFFFIQICVVLIFSVDNFLILHLLGPDAAANYNIGYRYFNIPNVIFTILIAPLWTAFAEAYTKRDFEWIKNCMKKLQLMFIIVMGAVILLALVYQPFFKIWLGKNGSNVRYRIVEIIGFVALFSIMAWNNIFASLYNGLSATRLQIYTSIFGILSNIPLAYLFIKAFRMGIEGVLLSMCISLSYFAFAAPLNFKKLLR